MNKIFLIFLSVSFISATCFSFFHDDKVSQFDFNIRMDKAKYLQILGLRDAQKDITNRLYAFKYFHGGCLRDVRNREWGIIYLRLLKDKYNINTIDTDIDHQSNNYADTTYSNYLDSYNGFQRYNLENMHSKYFWDSLKILAKRQYCKDWWLHGKFPWIEETNPPFKIKYNDNLCLFDSLFGKGSYGNCSINLKVTKDGQVLSSMDYSSLALHISLNNFQYLYDNGLLALDNKDEEENKITKKEYSLLLGRSKVYLNKVLKSIAADINKGHYRWVLNDTLKKSFEFDIRSNFYPSKIVKYQKYFDLTGDERFKSIELYLSLDIELDHDGKKYEFDTELKSKYEYLVQEVLKKAKFIVDKNNEYFHYHHSVIVGMEIYNHAKYRIDEIKKEMLKKL